MIGKTYAIPPQPPVAANTRYFSAGNLSLGVEYRELDPAGLLATYEDNPAHLQEFLKSLPDGGFNDEGVSLHVCDASTGHEYLRFDILEDAPHYHYNHLGSEIVNNVVDFDVAADGAMLPWALERLRTRLREMLVAAGAAHLVAGLDPVAIDRAVDQIAEIAERAQEKNRRLGAARAEST